MIVTTADNLPRLIRCNGSRLMPPSFDRSTVENKLRDEGIAAHWASCEIFRGSFTLEEIADRKAPNGTYITSDIIDLVDAYLGALDCGEVEADTSFSGQGYQINGRCDHRKYSDVTRTLTIDDLKTGWGIVEPEHNWTLVAHAIGTIIQLATQGIQPEWVELRIHQPRPSHPDGKLRTWRLSYADLMVEYGKLDTALRGLNDTLHSDPDICRKCWANATCPAAREAGYNGIDAMTKQYSDDMSGEELAYEIGVFEAAAAHIKLRVEALKELGLHRTGIGQVVPGYAREPQYGHSKWKDGLDPATTSLILGVDVTKTGFATPAEAKRRGAPEHVVKSLTYRPSTGTKLVRTSADKQAKRLFNR